jgi:hypothetical protein
MMGAMKKHVYKTVVALMGATALAAGVSWWLSSLPSGINRQGFDMIRPGMSRRDVEAILGGPPGDYTHAGYNQLDTACFPLVSVGPESDVCGCRRETWRCCGRLVAVYFRDGEAVADKEFLDFEMILQQSLLQRIRHRVGL